MRKKLFLFAIMMACTVSSAFAQMSSNVNHLNFAVGALYERGLDATLSYEHETRYHHAWPLHDHERGVSAAALESLRIYGL